MPALQLQVKSPMSAVSAGVLTPVFEITIIGNSRTIALTAPSDRIRALHTYRAPQVQNHGSERHYVCTHKVVSGAYLTPNRHCLLNITKDPIASCDLHNELALRYQLNPYYKHHLQPQRRGEIIVFESSSLREVFVEIVSLQDIFSCAELWSADALHGVCGINLYTRAEGVFSSSNNIVPVGSWGNSCKEGNMLLIYSTIPHVKRSLYKPFDTSADSPRLVVDEAFIGWDTLGWVSLNELHDMGALHAVFSGESTFDLEYDG